ncbi:response regulator transcription factor [Nocardioides immobilis]|uniref:response regulator transcription factor n=1 Tax=Nocardioides immobilis TaxID=2049295 RepID=UPI0015F94FFA|nr:response regulator transcription factor [Nocardioides immobilis]
MAAALGQDSARPSATPLPNVHPTIPGGLTRRQWEIAQLLGEGLSNKEIAARLVISRRTAEAHVENILTKLGFTSRTQVTSWAIDQHGRRN